MNRKKDENNDNKYNKKYDHIMLIIKKGKKRKKQRSYNAYLKYAISNFGISNMPGNKERKKEKVFGINVYTGPPVIIRGKKYKYQNSC